MASKTTSEGFPGGQAEKIAFLEADSHGGIRNAKDRKMKSGQLEHCKSFVRKCKDPPMRTLYTNLDMENCLVANAWKHSDSQSVHVDPLFLPLL